MLNELLDLLEMFEFVTDELQSNKVNISRVYPAIAYLKNNILKEDEEFKYSNEIRKEMLASLKGRFDKLIEHEVFLISTLLDPHFGFSYFKDKHQDVVKARVLAILKRERAIKQVILKLSECYVMITVLTNY